MTYPQPIDEYIAHQEQIQAVNNIYNGSDSSVVYLDKYGREEDEVFNTRKKRATLNNYVKRAIETRKNIIFRKPITIETKNTQLEELVKNIDIKGTSLNEFLKECAVSADKDGYVFAITDTPIANEEIKSIADEKKNNIRPYATMIKRNDVIYWRKDSFGNFTVIAYLESYEENDGTTFGFKVKQQIKVLFDTGTVQIYRDNELYDTFDKSVKQITIKQLGSQKIPMFYDMAKDTIIALNRESEKQSYLRQSLVAVPLLWRDTPPDSESKVVVGLNNGFVFGNKTTEDFQIREVSGNNYKIAQEELNEITKKIELDSIKFATESTGNKTAYEVSKDATVDEAKLSDRAIQIEEFANGILQDFNLLKTDLNLSEDDKVIVNKDFSTNKLSHEQARMLQELYLNEIISWDRIISALEDGEILKVLSSDEREVEKTNLSNSSLGSDLE
jgi:hypothetical protein